MYTGKNFSDELSIRARQTNASAYFSPARKSYCIRFAITKVIEDSYFKLSKQRSIDRINPLIKTYSEYIPNNNKVLLKPLAIFNIVTILPNSFSIVFNREHNLPVGWVSPVTIADVQGLTGINTTTIGTYSTPTIITVTITGVTGTYTANTGNVVSDYWISDYYHLLAVGINSLTNLHIDILSLKQASTYTDLIVGENNLRNGERIYFQGFGGHTDYLYIKKITDRKVRLYNDKELLSAFTNPAFNAIGVIFRLYSKYSEPLLSDSKISSYAASEIFPMYELNQNYLRGYTSENNIDTSISQILYLVDFITNQANIDITNDTIDLLEVYNIDMINEVLEQSVLKFFVINSSGEDVQITEAIK